MKTATAALAAALLATTPGCKTHNNSCTPRIDQKPALGNILIQAPLGAPRPNPRKEEPSFSSLPAHRLPVDNPYVVAGTNKYGKPYIQFASGSAKGHVSCVEWVFDEVKSCGHPKQFKITRSLATLQEIQDALRGPYQIPPHAQYFQVAIAPSFNITEKGQLISGNRQAVVSFAEELAATLEASGRLPDAKLLGVMKAIIGLLNPNSASAKLIRAYIKHPDATTKPATPRPLALNTFHRPKEASPKQPLANRGDGAEVRVPSPMDLLHDKFPVRDGRYSIDNQGIPPALLHTAPKK